MARSTWVLAWMLAGWLLGGLSGPAAAGERLKIAVLDLGDKGVGGEVVSLLPAVISKQLSSYGLFEVLSRDDIRKMLSHEQDKALLGCDDAGCMADIGGALGAEALVAGDVGKVGDKYLINLQRIAIRDAEVENRAARQFEGPASQLLEETRLATHELVADLLEAASGRLVMSVSEEGADVSVDGDVVGTSPLQPLELPAGPHEVRVDKEGFVTWARTVRVKPDASEVLDVTLMPSASFIAAYEQRAGSMRRWAWITAAAFLAFEAAAVGMRIYTWQEIDPIERDYNDGEYRGLTQEEFYDKYEDDVDLGETLDYTALGLGIGGLALGAISLYLFIEGEDPDRYQRFRSADTAAALLPDRAGFAPAAGGGRFSLAWEF